MPTGRHGAHRVLRDGRVHDHDDRRRARRRAAHRHRLGKHDRFRHGRRRSGHTPFQPPTVSLASIDTSKVGDEDIESCTIASDGANDCFTDGNIGAGTVTQSDGSKVAVLVVKSLRIETAAHVTVTGGLPLAVLNATGDMTILLTIDAHGAGDVGNAGGYTQLTLDSKARTRRRRGRDRHRGMACSPRRAARIAVSGVWRRRARRRGDGGDGAGGVRRGRHASAVAGSSGGNGAAGRGGRRRRRGLEPAVAAERSR